MARSKSLVEVDVRGVSGHRLFSAFLAGDAVPLAADVVAFSAQHLRSN